MRQFLRSKTHRATITRTDLHDEGSLTLDRELMDAAGIADHEVIRVVNVNNGERRSGVVGLNRAATRLGMPRDVVIMTFEHVGLENGTIAPTPIVVGVNAANRITDS